MSTDTDLAEHSGTAEWGKVWTATLHGIQGWRPAYVRDDGTVLYSPSSTGDTPMTNVGRLHPWHPSPNVCHMHYSASSPTSKHMTTAEVSALLGKDKTTVNRWADSGRLRTAAKAPGLRGARLFDPADVEALAAELGRGQRSRGVSA